LEGRLMQRVDELEDIAQERWQGLSLALEEEENQLQSRAQRQDNQATEAQTQLGYFAYRNFVRIQKQLEDLIAEARYGGVTATWNEREEIATSVTKLSEQRTRELRSID